MKKALKITGITLAALVGLVLIVVGIALAMLTSSGRLTKIIKHYAPQLVNCETELGKASLTLFKTFPNVGVGIEHVALINPMGGSPSDTLANIDDLTLVLDIKKLLKEKEIVVRQCILENAFVNIYTDSVGNSNLNIFNTQDNTDTTSSTFDYLVNLEEIKLKNSTAFLTDVRTQFAMQVIGFDLDLKGNFQDNDLNAELSMKVNDFEMMNYAAPFALKNVSLGFNGSMKQFDQIEGVLTAFKPDFHFHIDEPLKNDTVNITLPFQFISNIDFLFDPNLIDFKNCTFRLGQSDLSLQGRVTGIKDQMESHGSTVKGELKLNTDLLNVKEIVELINGLDLSKDAKPKDTVNKESGPFMVPEGIDLAIDLNTKKTVYGSIDFDDLRGTVTMKDNALVLQEISFTNKAAGVQLSALYQSPHEDSLFFAMDLHLKDMQIKDLLHLVPYFDTLVPMLKTFDGQAEFNIDVETNLKPNYQPNISTLRAAANVKGKNLTVNDKFTFTKITDMLLVSTDGAYCVDTLDVQLAFFDKKLNLWPSQIAIGKYKAVADGYMTPDKYAEYHISLTETPFPLHHGLKISGPFDKLKFDLETSKYPTHYKPLSRSERKQLHDNIRKKTADRLKEKSL